MNNLPDDQKESEIDKKLAKLRKSRKEGVKIVNGSMISISERDETLEGNLQSRPDFTKDKESLEGAYKVAFDYVINHLKIPKRGVYGHDLFQCIDPRINEIYSDEDKGVAKGYENENIFIIEYEEKEDQYKYLVLVRDSKKSPWRVIHNGTSYKK